MRFILPIMSAILLLASVAFGQVLFSEDFANGSLQNTWYPGFNGNTMEVEFQTGNPSGDNWVGKLGNDLSGGGVGHSFSGSMTLDDFYYEAQVYIPVDQGTYYGIEFRIDSVGITAGYQFVARFKPGGMVTPRLRFRVRPPASPSQPVVIKDWESADIPGGIPTTSGWHKLAVKAVGNQFWFYFDDQELPGCPYSDNTFSSGWIGAYIWDFALSPIYLYIDDILVTNPNTDISGTPDPVVSDFELDQNYPNPFNPTTSIRFNLPISGSVELTVYNALGQRVRSLLNGSMSAGGHMVTWDATDDLGNIVPAGIYYYQLRSGSTQATRKMMLMK